MPFYTLLLEKVKKDTKAKFNILGLHAGITWDDVYKMGEFNELIIPGKVLSMLKDFDYISLGHWHRFLPINKISNAYYSGSTERFSFREAGYPKGIVFADLAEHKAELIPIEVREMIKLGPVNCSGKIASEVLDMISKLKAQNKIDGCIIQLKLENLVRSTYVQLDLKHIRELLAEAFHVDIHPELVSEEDGGSAVEKPIDALPLEFERFLAGIKMPEKEKKEFVSLGTRYINQAQEKEQL